jgi:hypothetical protein
MTEFYDYNTPSEGTVDWHVPLNENFGAISEDVSTLADRLGVTVSGNYAEPTEGSVDWHVPLNENFESIEDDVQTLADAAGVGSVGGYNTPAAGTTDWHVPLNENFERIDGDLADIADVLAADSPSISARRKSLTEANVWYDIVNNYGADGDTLVDISDYNGGDLGSKFESAVADAEATDSRPVFFIPSGSYTWSTEVAFNPIELNGPMLLVHPDSQIDVTTRWALNLSGYTGRLSPDVDAAFRLIGGTWKPTHGILRQQDSFRGEFSPDTVTGGRTALKLTRTGDEFCEGWTFRDSTFDGVDRPLEMDSSSADQQLLSNLTFRDFDVGYNADIDSGSTTQNWTAINPRFENPRPGAIGMKTGNYCTGTVYAPVWTDGSGVAFDFNDSGTNPSIVDPKIASDAELWSGQYGPLEQTAGQAWTQAQSFKMFSARGPELPTPVVRADTYSGDSLSSQVETAAADLSSGGTILVPSAGVHAWEDTVSFDLAGRDIRLVATPNTIFDVSASSWTLDITGDGTFGVYGGDWRGSSGYTGFLRATATNLDVAVKQIRGWSDGKSIVVKPSTKGIIRIFDTKFHGFGGGLSSPAVTIGGAGASTFAHTTCEYSYGDKCIQIDSEIDELQCVRVSSHTYSNNSVFADTNAPIQSGGWHNIKFESFGKANQTVFDNGDTSSPGDVVEPVVFGGDEPVNLWTGTEPRTFPDIGRSSATKYEP